MQPAACPLWKKVKGSGAAPHLSRWFDFMASLPECVAAAEELDPRAAAARAKAADAAAGGAHKGGGGERGAGARFGAAAARSGGGSRPGGPGALQIVRMPTSAQRRAAAAQRPAWRLSLTRWLPGPLQTLGRLTWASPTR